jgi:hypothetical protein
MTNLFYPMWKMDEEDGSIWPTWDEIEEARGLSLDRAKEKRWPMDFPYNLGKQHLSLLLSLYDLDSMVIFFLFSLV